MSQPELFAGVVPNDTVERKKVVELARKGLIDMILVTELYRWGRSTTDLRSSIDQLASLQVAIRGLNGPALDIAISHNYIEKILCN